MKSIFKHLTAIIAITFIASNAVSAQNCPCEEANKAFKKLNYAEAIKLYEAGLKSASNPEAISNLADCYRLTANFVKAEEWYSKAVNQLQVKPINYLYLGQAMLANGKADQAKSWFEKYKVVVAEKRAKSLIEGSSLAAQKKLKDAGAGFTVMPMSAVNSTNDDFGPAYRGLDVIFNSDRVSGNYKRLVHTWTGNPFHELYKFPTTQELGTSVTPFAKSINTKYHDSNISFSQDGNTAYFTRNNYVGKRTGRDASGIIGLKILEANVDGQGNFVNVQEMPFNNDNYNCAHPSLSPDGQFLVFASDMPGGFGGMDLYVTRLEGGGWSNPMNLGSAINTEGNEVFPFIFNNEEVYFSSDAHAGLGGYDIFSAAVNLAKATSSDVLNLGSPLNSTYDDLTFIMNKERTSGYFASNRYGGMGGDDLYKFTRKPAPVEVYVYDELTGEPIAMAEVTNTCLGGKLMTQNDGKNKLNLLNSSTCSFSAKKKGFQPNSADLPVGAKFVRIPLKREMPFLLSGIVRSSKGPRIEGALIEPIVHCQEGMPAVSTPGSGTFDYRLSNNCDYLYRVSKDGYVPKEVKVSTKGHVPPKNFSVEVILDPIQVNVAPSQPLVEKRSEYTKEELLSSGMINLEHIYYDFDKWYIREDASTDLYKLLKIMNDYPDIIVEIGSHTDSRGSFEYNEKLSRKRAESVVQWLKQHNISAGRLRFKGYGETQLSNRCADGIKCTEEEHQRNRRTTFLVLGIVGPNGETILRSGTPENIKVDACKHCPR